MDVKLVMFKRDGRRKDFPVQGEVTVIGRGENCDLRVPILSVSRQHCELHLSGDQFKVKDLASSNGTYVNNTRVNEVELQPGDRIAVGPIVFTVQVDGKPEEISPVKTKAQQMAEAGQGGAEELVELEPEVTAKAPAAEAEPAEALAAAGEVGGEEEIDPIAALEALADEAEADEGENT